MEKMERIENELKLNSFIKMKKDNIWIRDDWNIYFYEDWIEIYQDIEVGDKYLIIKQDLEKLREVLEEINVLSKMKEIENKK